MPSTPRHGYTDERVERAALLLTLTQDRQRENTQKSGCAAVSLAIGRPRV